MNRNEVQRMRSLCEPMLAPFVPFGEGEVGLFNMTDYPLGAGLGFCIAIRQDDYQVRYYWVDEARQPFNVSEIIRQFATQ